MHWVFSRVLLAHMLRHARGRYQALLIVGVSRLYVAWLCLQSTANAHESPYALTCSLIP